ncbi:hypothetical protein CR513_14237, partial [Mucuna pruriens]
MVDTICRHDPWSVEVLLYRSDKIVCEWAVEIEEPFFYFYKTLFSKLGIKLPFIDFEWAALQVLNIALTQLHPNSWAFVQAFELLCEDMGNEPLLSVFFWFFSLRRAKKVSWTSLSNRPWRKLMKSFWKSYKFFKDHFFRVAVGHTRSSMLFGESGDPFFPLYWSGQSTILITVDRDDLEDWEEEFIEDLSQLPTLSCSKFITDKGYSIKDLVILKMRSSRSITLVVGGAVAEAAPFLLLDWSLLGRPRRVLSHLLWLFWILPKTPLCLLPSVPVICR